MLLHTSSAFIMRNETRHANRLCYLFRAATLLIEDHLDSGPLETHPETEKRMEYGGVLYGTLVSLVNHADHVVWKP